MNEKDEFFGEENAEGTQTGKTPVQEGERIPALPGSPKKWIVGVACALGALIIAALSFGGGMLVRWYSIDPEMRTLIEIKNKIDKEYYRDIPDDEFYGALFATVNNELLDTYSEYMTAEEYRASVNDLAGNRSGIGVSITTLSAQDQAQMLISRVCSNSPAEESGLKVGEYIVGFGERETGLTESEKFEDFTEFLAHRKDGETFYIRLRAGETYRVVPICKREFVENYVYYRTNDTAYAFTGENALTMEQKGESLACLDDETGYIRLVQFTGNASKGFDAVMQQFKLDGKKDLVLDLRGNGGGYLDYVQEIAKYFCKNTTETRPVAVTAAYADKNEYYLARGNVYAQYFKEDSRIIVLADSGTASASECLIGVMMDYGAIDYTDICLSERNGVARTYGKGIMQTTFAVDYFKGDAIKLTTAAIRWPVSGYSIHERGVLPQDGCATVEENYEGDAEIENALNALR